MTNIIQFPVPERPEEVLIEDIDGYLYASFLEDDPFQFEVFQCDYTDALFFYDEEGVEYALPRDIQETYWEDE